MCIKAFIGVVVATAALTACSSGSSSSNANGKGNKGADKILATDAGSAAKALSDGKTLRASGRASSAWVRTFTDGADTAVLAGDPTVRIRKNNKGGLDLITSEGTITFTAAHLSADGDGFQLPDGSASIWSWNGEGMADALNAEGKARYSLAFDYHFDFNNNNQSRNGFAVIGTETADSALPALPKAKYEGYAAINVAPSEGFEDWDTQLTRLEGGLVMNADFGAGTVGGSVDKFVRREPNDVDPTKTWTPFDGSLTLETTNIVGNGFEGTVTADQAFKEAIGTVGAGSGYAGTFFGPGAEEVAGGLTLTGEAADLTNVPNGTTYLGYGLIQGWKN